MAGRRARFEKLAMPVVDSLYRQAMKLTNNPDDAQDLVQNPLMSCGSSVQTSPRMISRSSPCLSSSRAADSRVKAMFSCSPCV